MTVKIEPVMEKQETIPIFAINRLKMSTDGHGVRTLIGAYGCPLRCKYCLNPHSWSNSIQPRIYTPESLFDEVKIDNLYFQATEGGLTFGGGEPLLHSSFIKRFSQLCPESWSLYAETSLNGPFENVAEVADIFEHFVVDIKSMDPEIYHAYTGGDLAPALDNLKWLLEHIGSDRITVRIPIIPGYTDETSQKQSVDQLRALGFQKINTFRYRSIGK